MAVAATGFFDGVHCGHRQVIGTLLSEAARLGEQSLVITFWPHPRTVLQSDARTLRLLTSLSEKRDMLHGLGVHRVEVLDFSRALSRLSAAEYLRMIADRYSVTHLVLGYDTRMGCDQLGPEEITAIAASMGMGSVIVPPVDLSQLSSGCSASSSIVSSTKVRAALARGDVEAAEDMLGRPYMLHGAVVAGNQLGRSLGFPTANMQLYEPLKTIPSNGVYLTEVDVLGGHFHGMTNIGVRPTVGTGNALTIETHIFDFSEMIYGLDIRVSFKKKIRDERKFGSLSELALQLAADRAECIERL